MAGEIGSAYADIRANLSKLDADISAARKKLLDAVKKMDEAAKVTIRLDDDPAVKALRALELRIGKVVSDAFTATINVNVNGASAAEKQLSDIAAIAAEVDANDVTIKVDVDGTAAAEKQLSDVAVIAAEVDANDVSIVVDVIGAEQAAAEILVVSAAASDADKKIVDIPITTPGAEISAYELAAVEKASRGLSGGLLGGLGAIAAIAGLTAGLGSLATQGVQSVAALEQVSVAFTGLFRNKDVAADFIQQLEEFAAVTPFEFDQLVGSAQRFLGAFGAGFRDEIIPTLTAIGDVTASLGAPADAISRITTAILQIKGKGRVATEELNQIREALPGFDPLKAIAEQLGISIPVAMQMIEKRALPAEKALEALITGMKEFPGAAGAMERQSRTLNGRLSTLKDTFKIVLREGFQPLADVAGTALDAAAAALAEGGSLYEAVATLGKTISGAVADVFPVILPAVQAVVSGIAPLVQGLGQTLGPVLEVLGTGVEQIGRVLGGVLTALAPALESIAPALQEIVVAAGDIAIAFIPIIEALAPALVSIFQGLAPIATILADVLAPILRVIGSVLEALPGPLLAVVAGFIAFGPAGAILAGVGAIVSAFGAKAREMEARTNEVREALVAQTTTLLTNKDALAGITDGITGLAAAQVVLSRALVSSTKDGQRLALALGTLKIPIADALVIYQQFGIDSELALRNAGKAAGDFSEAQRTAMAKVVDSTDDALLAFSLLRDNELFKDVPDDELKAIVLALEELQDQVEKTDLDKLITDTIALKAANDEAFASALALAESTTGIRSTTTDADEAVRLYTKTLEIYAGTVNEAEAADRQARAFTQWVVDTYAAAKIAADKYKQAQVALKLAFQQLATPVEATALALDAVRSALDKLTGTKVDLAQARSEVEALLDSIVTRFTPNEDGVADLNFKFGFDIDVEEGRKNLDLLIEAAGKFSDEAVGVFGESGSATEAANLYAQRLGQFRHQFILAGGSVEEFDQQVRDLGLDPVTFRVGLDNGAKAAVLAEIAKLQASAPDLVTRLKALVDKGLVVEAQDVLNGLKVDPRTGEARLAKYETAVSQPSVEKTDDELDAIAEQNRTALIGVSTDNSEIARANRILADLARTRTVRIGVNVPVESGGYFVRRYEDGGMSDIARTPSHYVAAGAGPVYMYGEPSTQGEYFISMKPAFRDRNKQLVTEAAQRLGIDADGRGAGNVAVLEGFDEIVGRLERLEIAMREMPPITVVTHTNDAQALGSRVFWAFKERTG